MTLKQLESKVLDPVRKRIRAENRPPTEASELSVEVDGAVVMIRSAGMAVECWFWDGRTGKLGPTMGSGGER